MEYGYDSEIIFPEESGCFKIAIKEIAEKSWLNIIITKDGSKESFELSQELLKLLQTY